MRGRIAVLTSGLCASAATAHADHPGMAMAMGPRAGGSTFGAGVSVLAARYATSSYGGDYEGVVPAASWSRGRFAAGAALPFYRLLENGNRQYGFGDLVVHGQVAIVDASAVHGGVMLAVSAPTGDGLLGFGMGHVMVMPGAWGAWTAGRLTLSGSAGYSRALVDLAGHHDHGPWPLVEPMDMSELTWSGGGEVTIGSGIRGGMRLSGGVPVGLASGHARVIGACRVAWTAGRVDTGVELQAGLAGDPFIIRGVVDTALRF